MFFVRLLRFTLYVTPIFFLFIAGTFLISYSKSSKKQEDKYTEEEEKTILEKEKKVVKKETFNNKVKKIEEGVSTYIKEEPYLFNIEKKKYYKVSMITNFYNQRFKDSAFTLNIENTKKLNLVALGLDEKYHMSNYYLEGFAPFITNSIYLPLMTIGTKKAYQLDHLGKLRKKRYGKQVKKLILCQEEIVKIMLLHLQIGLFQMVKMLELQLVSMKMVDMLGLCYLKIKKNT